MVVIRVRIAVPSPMAFVPIFYYFTIFISHMLNIGMLLVYPQVRSDISIHIKMAYELIAAEPLATPSIGFQVLLAFAILLTPNDVVFIILPFLSFINLLAIWYIYDTLRTIFPSNLPALLGTLAISSLNLAWIFMIPCFDVLNLTLTYRCVHPYEALIFTSRFNISSYFLLQISPFSVSLIITFFIVKHFLTQETLKIMKIAPLIFFLYSVHPLYSLLLPVFIWLFSSLSYKVAGRQYRNIYGCIAVAGFLPLAVSILLTSTPLTYRFQALAFSIINVILAYLLHKLTGGRIQRILQNLSLLNKKFYAALFLFSVVFWIYGIYNMMLLSTGFNAWRLDYTPLWLYPLLVGFYPLILMFLLTVRARQIHFISFKFLLCPLIFVIPAPLVDFINLNLAEYYVDGYRLYAGFTSGRLLAIANLLYSIGGGAAIGYYLAEHGNRLSKVFSISLIVGLGVTASGLFSTAYWHTIRLIICSREPRIALCDAPFLFP